MLAEEGTRRADTGETVRRVNESNIKLFFQRTAVSPTAKSVVYYCSRRLKATVLTSVCVCL